MTRGTLYFIDETGNLFKTPEFNGDMYIDNGYGEDALIVLEELRKSGNANIDSFKELVMKFNAEHHQYDDISDERWTKLVGTFEELKQVMDRQCSDYSFVLDMKQNKVRAFSWHEEITDDEEVKNVLNNNAEAEQSEIEILKKKVTELSKRLDFALDCLDDCHGMAMYWAEFPEEEE